MRLLITTIVIFASIISGNAKTVNVSTAGTLNSHFIKAEEDTVTKIIVSGSIDYRDFRYMSDNLVMLTSIDLSASNIMAYSNNAANMIPSSAFGGRVKLKTIILPNSTTAIFDFAFNACSGLTSMVLPPNLTYIGNGIFQDCINLLTVTIPQNVNDIKSSAFIGCNNLNEILVSAANNNYSALDGVLLDKNKTKIICYPGAKVGEYSIPNTVTSVDEYTFNDCLGLTILNIPAGFTTFPISTINGCSNLLQINVNDANLNYSSVDGVLFDKLKTTLMRVPEGRIGAYTIPSSVATIGTYGMFQCKYISSITIPTSVNTIKFNALSGCSDITELLIPNSVTSIESNSIKSCSKLVTVSLPNTLTELKSATFSECTSLKTINLPLSLTKIGDMVFQKCGFETITLPDNCTSIGSLSFSKCSKLTSIALPSQLRTIGAYSFQENSSLKSISIPDSVKTIGQSTFYGCTSLMSIETKTQFPIDISSSPQVFEQVSKTNCKLYVVSDTAKYRFQQADQWQDFFQIIVGTPSEIKYARSEKIKIYSLPGEIHIKSFTKIGDIQIYSIDGRLTKQVKSESESIEIPIDKPGIYIVKTSASCQKIVVN